MASSKHTAMREPEYLLYPWGLTQNKLTSDTCASWKESGYQLDADQFTAKLILVKGSSMSLFLLPM